MYHSANLLSDKMAFIALLFLGSFLGSENRFSSIPNLALNGFRLTPCQRLFQKAINLVGRGQMASFEIRRRDPWSFLGMDTVKL